MPLIVVSCIPPDLAGYVALAQMQDLWEKELSALATDSRLEANSVEQEVVACADDGAGRADTIEESASGVAC